ncbi:phosphate ABC transporter substrate-binding protein [Chloroflexi bacterium TSY]|nr:phosphate ABC transporter substrate-binding protein [Chloroflexi bacterium TSY]
MLLYQNLLNHCNHTGIRVSLLTFCIAIILSACSQTTFVVPDPVTIRIAGATTLKPVLQKLTVEFSHRHPHVLFDYREGGSTLGEQWLRDGRIDLAASILSPKEQPVDSTDDIQISLEDDFTAPDFSIGEPLVYIPIGLDGLAIVVHASNRIENVSLLELRDLFSGRLLNWAELNGDLGEVLVVSREDGSGARILFEERVMVGERVTLTAVVMPASADVITYVAKSPTAIGYVSRAYVDQLIRIDLQKSSREIFSAQVDEMASRVGNDTKVSQIVTTDAVRILSVDGLTPIRSSLEDQSYYLTYPLYLISRGEPSGLLGQFIDYVLSPAGQEIVGDYHASIWN